MLKKKTPAQMRPAEVRNTADSPEGLEEYLEFRAETDLRWPYAVPPEFLSGTQRGAEHEARGAEAPLVVFINARSGGRAGPALATALSHALGRAQVFDLTQHRPDRVLARIWRNLQEAEARGDARAAATRRRLRVVACGGDGTIAWILKSIASLGLDPPPPVAVVPLGTGNDLSRTFGWGAAYSHAWFSGYQATYKALRRFAESPPADLDRWRVRLFVPDRQFLPSRTYAIADPGDGGEAALAEGAREASAAIAQVLMEAQKQQQQQQQQQQQALALQSSSQGGAAGSRGGAAAGRGGVFSSSGGGGCPLSPLSGARVQPPAGWRPALQEGPFWNYFSIGADALAAFRFHHMREDNPSCAGSRLANQFWYSYFSCSSGWFAPASVPSCARDAAPVARFVAVEVLDGDGLTWRPLAVPSSIRALVVVNLQSYGGGRNIWGAGVPNPAAPPRRKGGGSVAGSSASGGGGGRNGGNGGNGTDGGGGGGGGGAGGGSSSWQPTVNRPPSVSDGLFELVGFASGYHAMAVMASHAKVAHGVRLAQASGIRVALKAAVAQADGSPGRVYLQMDGEPWEQPVPSGVGEPPAVVEIVHDGVSRVLSNRARGGDMDRPGGAGTGAGAAGEAGAGAAAAAAGVGSVGGVSGVSGGGYSLGGGGASAEVVPPARMQERYLEEISQARAPLSPMTTGAAADEAVAAGAGAGAGAAAAVGRGGGNSTAGAAAAAVAGSRAGNGAVGSLPVSTGGTAG